MTSFSAPSNNVCRSYQSKIAVWMKQGEPRCATLLYLVGVMGFWLISSMGCGASDAVGWLWLWWSWHCCRIGLVLPLVMSVTFCWQDYMVLVAQLEHQYKGVSLSCLNASPGQLFAIYMTLYTQLEHQSSIIEHCSRPDICYSYNTIVTAGVSVRRGESLIFEHCFGPGISHSQVWVFHS